MLHILLVFRKTPHYQFWLHSGSVFRASPMFRAIFTFCILHSLKHLFLFNVVTLYFYISRWVAVIRQSAKVVNKLSSIVHKSFVFISSWIKMLILFISMCFIFYLSTRFINFVGYIIAVFQKVSFWNSTATKIWWIPVSNNAYAKTCNEFKTDLIAINIFGWLSGCLRSPTHTPVLCQIRDTHLYYFTRLK